MEKNRCIHLDTAPAKTAVEVHSLFREDILIEIDAIVVLYTKPI